jgi:hypothetical protein
MKASSLIFGKDIFELKSVITFWWIFGQSLFGTVGS